MAIELSPNLLSSSNISKCNFSVSAVNGKLILFRTTIMCLILFIAETLPNFGAILGLIGGSTITLLTFVFPPTFYMLLMSRNSNSGKERSATTALQWLERSYCVALVAIGVFGGCLASYSASKELFKTEFKLPCYVGIH